mmetsp:Transcript_37940/g.122067  ORF Transcript_37940/g.122067 Transcript_37940/m.122067 type:complete len:260 (-) Transcript_37940:192-971(-)|eukprot:CAMPEP_0203877350 /NCGR_PEP_ID=MMETSP0359-20131031/21955_1 /ASSEMBLY_ACC=CAM_ASM_000338 /TAXON_ID=268821 /ORGANISM="Scrippsiella Hangoei, Strain SHTV-5" /LENGTH=259 /DNA_ID=CAMNT_0050796289 /DNA_START=151 /DNA_END=930 /DNA_ORIENTATION=-
MAGLLASERRIESGEMRTLAENSAIAQDGRQSAVKDQGGRKLTIAVLGVCVAVVLVALAARSGVGDAATASAPALREYENNFVDSPQARLAEAELEGTMASKEVAVQAEADGSIVVATITDYTETAAAEDGALDGTRDAGAASVQATFVNVGRSASPLKAVWVDAGGKDGTLQGTGGAGLASVKATFVNVGSGAGPMEAYWVDAGGKEKKVGSILAGERWVQHTYVGHTFRFRDQEGKLVEEHVVEEARPVAVVGAANT